MRTTPATDDFRKAAECLRFSPSDFVHLPDIRWWQVPMEHCIKEQTFGTLLRLFYNHRFRPIEERAEAGGQRLLRKSGPALISIEGRLSTGVNEIFLGVRVNLQQWHKAEGKAADTAVKPPLTGAPPEKCSNESESGDTAGATQIFESDEDRLLRLLKEELQFDISNSTGTLSVSLSTFGMGDTFELGSLEKITVKSGVLVIWGVGYTVVPAEETLPEEGPSKTAE